MSEPEIREAQTPADVEACYDVMHELRPHLSREAFVTMVAAMREEKYRVAFAREAGRVVAVAGFRLATHLAWGKTLYVDDLVTASMARSKGYGARMLAWLRRRAEQEGCDELHLDSGTWRTDAHRFYEREGLPKTAFHFSVKLKP